MAQSSPSEVPSVSKSSGCHFHNSATVMCYLCSHATDRYAFSNGKVDMGSSRYVWPSYHAYCVVKVESAQEGFSNWRVDMGSSTCV